WWTTIRLGRYCRTLMVPFGARAFQAAVESMSGSTAAAPRARAVPGRAATAASPAAPASRSRRRGEDGREEGWGCTITPRSRGERVGGRRRSRGAGPPAPPRDRVRDGTTASRVVGEGQEPVAGAVELVAVHVSGHAAHRSGAGVLPDRPGGEPAGDGRGRRGGPVRHPQRALGGHARPVAGAGVPPARGRVDHHVAAGPRLVGGVEVVDPGAHLGGRQAV